MSIEKVLACIIAAFLQGLAATIIISKQVKLNGNRDRFKFFVPITIYCIIGQLFIPNQIRFILYMLVMIIIMYFILKIKDNKITLYAFNSLMILSFSEFIITCFLIFIGINSNDIVNNFIYNFLANVLISLVTIILVNIPIVKKLLYKIINLFVKNRKLINYLYIFIVMLYLIVLRSGLELILKANYYINILFIFVIILIIVIIIRNELKYDNLNEQNKQMLNYVTKYEKIITEQGKANHEFKNQLMVIRGYAQMNSPKLIEYLDSIVEDANKTHSSYLISQLNKFPDGGIKGLLYYKLSIMDDENIKYEIDVEDGVKNKLNSLVTIEYKNITKILGVLLDNAIDASKHAKIKKIIISVTKEKSTVMFSIYNTYKGRIDLSKIGTGHTTKGKGHGYGLRLVNDIIEENNIFGVSNCLENEYYVSKLSIKIIKKKKK